MNFKSTVLLGISFFYVAFSHAFIEVNLPGKVQNALSLDVQPCGEFRATFVGSVIGANPFKVIVKNQSNKAVKFKRSAFLKSYSCETVEALLSRNGIIQKSANLLGASLFTLLLWKASGITAVEYYVRANGVSLVQNRAVPRWVSKFCKGGAILYTVLYTVALPVLVGDIADAVNAKKIDKPQHYQILDSLMPESVSLKPGEQKEYIIFVKIF